MGTLGTGHKHPVFFCSWPHPRRQRQAWQMVEKQSLVFKTVQVCCLVQVGHRRMCLVWDVPVAAHLFRHNKKPSTLFRTKRVSFGPAGGCHLRLVADEFHGGCRLQGEDAGGVRVCRPGNHLRRLDGEVMLRVMSQSRKWPPASHPGQ